VQGDGRCGHRAIAKDFGLSCQDVMREVLKLMVAHGDLFTVAEILAVASATGPRSRAAWRSNHHLSLLSQMGALFPRGIAVLKFEIDRAFIQFQGNGDVRVVSHLPPEGVCILGLVTQRMYHFVLLQGRKLALSSSPAMDPEVASHGSGNDSQKYFLVHFLLKRFFKINYDVKIFCYFLFFDLFLFLNFPFCFLFL
jgi:hypothetical protein